MRRLGGLGSFLLAALWSFRWEAVRAFLYEQGFSAMSSAGTDTLLHWGIPLLLAGVGVWLFWKTGSSGLSGVMDFSPSASFWHVPFDDAARRVYEAAEKASVVDLMISKDSKPLDKLYHFKMLLLVDDRVRLFGTKPPSTKSRLISKADLPAHDIYPSETDKNSLDHLYPAEHPAAYVNVTVPRSDLRRIIKIYLIEYVGEAKLLRAGKWPG